MPDVHWGLGATVGSVMPTRGPSCRRAVGVDIGAGWRGADQPPGRRTSGRPEGRAHRHRAGGCPTGARTGGPQRRGSWNAPPPRSLEAWKASPGYERIVDDHPKLGATIHPERQMGTLGTGNHFIEVCLDEADHVWF